MLGIDLIEIKRIENIIFKHPNFLKRVLGKNEYLQLKKRSFPTESIAGNFCAKEAFFKATGNGLSKTCLKNIQILRDNKGAPYIKVDKELSAVSNQSLQVSISHTKKYATAVVFVS